MTKSTCPIRALERVPAHRSKQPSTRVAGNIMSAYMDLNGVPATGNRWLLTDVLRDALGFDGFVVSDANSVKDLHTHHYAANAADASVRALELESTSRWRSPTPPSSIWSMPSATAMSRSPRVDESVRRLLLLKEQMGLFDDPLVDVGPGATSS